MSDKNRLIYLPLGGAGEIGMNMYLYGYGPKDNERFILVDVGVAFPDMESTPGVDLIMADPEYIEARADRLEAIFITHAHEDHVGAIGWLYPRLQAPVYCRKFTGAIARMKMETAGQDPDNVKIVEPYPAMTEAGPFRVGFVPISHSIPESAALVIDTPAGRLVHSGDFKTDPTPLVGEPFDPELLAEIAEPGIRALVCDSTNVFSLAEGRSEETLAEPITRLMGGATGMVVATTFASNVARLKTLAEAGRAAGRTVCVVGRAMNQMISTALETGVLEKFPHYISAEESAGVARSDLLVLATGSQGERRAATASLARGSYLGLEMKAGDTFLFSSKTIPGNEVPVIRILNQLAEIGVTVVDDSAGKYHVSGHANRPDLERLHAILKPQVLIPMHGEYRHLRAHAELFEAKGGMAAVAPNGAMIDLTKGYPATVEQIETGRTYRDGNKLIGALDGIVRARIQMAIRGHVVVSVMIDDEGRSTGDAWAEVIGLPNDKLDSDVEEQVDNILARATRKTLQNDDAVEELVSQSVRRLCNDLVGKKPVVTVLISRLEG